VLLPAFSSVHTVWDFFPFSPEFPPGFPTRIFGHKLLLLPPGPASKTENLWLRSLCMGICIDQSLFPLPPPLPLATRNHTIFLASRACLFLHSVTPRACFPNARFVRPVTIVPTPVFSSCLIFFPFFVVGRPLFFLPCCFLGKPCVGLPPVRGF